MSTTTATTIRRNGVRRATSLSGAQAVAQVIAYQHDPVVYGMPGGHTMQIFDALYPMQDRVSTRLVRQESVATVMAEARGRLTGRPAFVIGQGAWVLGNAGVGIMEAHLGSSPVVLLIDATDGGAFAHHGPYQAGFGGHGAYDLAAAVRAITKQTFTALDATQALQMTQLAVKHATTGEPGPVAVVFHSEALLGRIQPGQPPAYLGWSDAATQPAHAAEGTLDAAAGLIRGAKRPIVVAGNGVRLAKAEAALAYLAQATGTPVATTPAGKGVFPESDSLAVGVIGSFGHDTANAVVGESDLIVAVGTKLGASDTAGADSRLIDLQRQRLVHIDLDPLNVSWTWPNDVAVVGDAQHALTGLAERLRGHDAGGVDRVAAARAQIGYFDRLPQMTSGELSGRDVITTLSDRLAPDAVVTCDAGENRLFVLRDFKTKPGGTVLQPNGGGGMGYAVPSAMAAAETFPRRQAVAVCGDGGFSMSLTALLSAVELDLDITVVVLDNRVLGWVYSGQRGRTIASELHDFDYAGIARAMGATGVTVDSLEEFNSALDRALSHRGPSVIVAHTTTADKYQDLMSALNTGDVYAVVGDD
ncbi:thiamine pyrophosphate-binding protein [Agromyces sp. ZXT2-6]|uniref:thiamine pyrophosphate-binding protein n=1 Tax=Agromyces sp. ZXT2-6 TaxID=3461153 RepID=UPI0040550450